MKPTTVTKLNSLQAINPALITSTSFKPPYRKRYEPKLVLSDLQKRGLNRILHGLKGYTADELKLMNEEDRRSVVYLSNKGWTIVNRLKQNKLNNLLTGILQSIIPNLCGAAVPILTAPITDSTFQVDRNIRECNVSEEVIIHSFIRAGLLPKNFLPV